MAVLTELGSRRAGRRCGASRSPGFPVEPNTTGGGRRRARCSGSAPTSGSCSAAARPTSPTPPPRSTSRPNRVAFELAGPDAADVLATGLLRSTSIASSRALRPDAARPRAGDPAPAASVDVADPRPPVVRAVPPRLARGRDRRLAFGRDPAARPLRRRAPRRLRLVDVRLRSAAARRRQRHAADLAPAPERGRGDHRARAEAGAPRQGLAGVRAVRRARRRGRRRERRRVPVRGGRLRLRHEMGKDVHPRLRAPVRHGRRRHPAGAPHRPLPGRGLRRAPLADQSRLLRREVLADARCPTAKATARTSDRTP